MTVSAFAQRQRDAGRSAEILRILKRAIAPRSKHHPPTSTPCLISRTERGLFITPEVVNRYRHWLNVA